MENELLNAWSRLCDHARTNTEYSLISPWMQHLHPKAVDASDTLVLVLDSETLAPFITSDHLRIFGTSLFNNRPVSVELRTAASDTPLCTYRTAPAQLTQPAQPDHPGLNPEMNLNTFHVGVSNRLAYAAAHAVIDTPGVQYNPVLIHGGIGMGKTHLLQAEKFGLTESARLSGARYFSGSEWVAEVTRAERANELDEWRSALLEGMDALIIDDIHSLAGHTTAEAELFTVFTALYNAKKQMVFSASCPPRRIRSLSERLSSRFHWGLVIELETLTEDMRRAIIAEKVSRQRNEMSPEVQEFQPQHVTTNIRELEGAILKLVGYSALLKTSVTLPIAREVLGEYFEETPYTPTVDDIQKATCEAADIELAALLSESRSHAVAYPRQVAMFLCRDLTSSSLEEIGRRFGGRDHSTVKYGCEKIRELSESDSKTRNLIRSIRDRLLNLR